MAQAKLGDVVQVHYTGKLEDGFVFDSSLEHEPLQFKIGDGYVLEGFEQAIIDMNIGDEKTISIKAEQAYGPYHNELIAKVPRTNFPANITPEIGQQIRINNQQNPKEPLIATIVDISETEVTLDANHPLAGKDLTFVVKLVSIV